MDFEVIKKLIELMEKSDMSEMEVEESEFRVKLTKNYPVNTPPPIVTVSAPQAQVPLSPPPNEKTEVFPGKEDLETVTSPMVGTLYRSPSPEVAPYVEKGDEVTKGQIICLIEAMKVMNEIECPYTGKVISILVENTQPVEYGEALFLIKPNSQ